MRVSKNCELRVFPEIAIFLNAINYACSSVARTCALYQYVHTKQAGATSESSRSWWLCAVPQYVGSKHAYRRDDRDAI